MAFLWGGAKIGDWHGVERYFGAASTVVALFALTAALSVITPREKLSYLVGKRNRWIADYKPVSFYGYIAKTYGKDDFSRMESDLAKMDDAAFADEALEQHFAISLIIQTKSEWVFRAGMITFCSIALAGIGLVLKILN